MVTTLELTHLLHKAVITLWLAMSALPLAAHESTAQLEAQVRAAEIAFAKTMADRDFAAFTRYVAADAVLAGARDILRGRAAVIGA